MSRNTDSSDNNKSLSDWLYYVNNVAIDWTDEFNYNALHKTLIQAPSHMRYNLIEILLNRGVDPRKMNVLGSSPAHQAFQSSDEKLIALFIDFIDVNAVIECIDCKTAVHLACIHNLPNTLKLLIDKGADVNSQNLKESTPLHLAKHHANLVKILVENRASVDIEDEDGYTPLTKACKLGYRKSIQEMLHQPGDIMSLQQGHDPAILLLLESGVRHCGVFEELIKKGANPHEKLYQKKNFLHIIASHPPFHKASIKLAKLFLNLGIDVNAQDENGHTALYFANKLANIRMVRFLFDRGAEIGFDNTISYLDDFDVMPENLKDIIAKNLLKTWTMTFQVNGDDMDKLITVRRYEEFSKECENEIRLLLLKHIPSTNINMYEILERSVEEIKNYFMDENFRLYFKEFRENDYPIYGKDIMKKYVLAKKRLN